MFSEILRNYLERFSFPLQPVEKTYFNGQVNNQPRSPSVQLCEGLTRKKPLLRPAAQKVPVPNTYSSGGPFYFAQNA